ncbi:MAG: metallophosphoesterase [Kiritimatiellae bacterium]|nr:metallophosphoesterase [Kiritimatiellia bacterium]
MGKMTRREFFGEFLVGGATFASLGAFAGNRFVLAAAGFKADGKPRLKFGVLSDIHILNADADAEIGYRRSADTFKHTLEWFKSQNVDAVAIAGDMADDGLGASLMAVSDAWYSVFPDGKRPDGRTVEKVFVTGNHDAARGGGKKKYADETERMRHVLSADLKGWWDKAFHEEYSPIYAKTVNGYTFIGSQWDKAQAGSGSWNQPFRLIEEYMAKNGKALDPSLPFFYVQHPHLKDTCYGPWAWGHDKGIATRTLSAYPNAIAFSGHSHYSLTDERSIWQGAFTSVGTGSLRYLEVTDKEFKPTGFENSVGDDWRANAAKMLGRFNREGCRNGMLWSVYDDCIVVKRREFVSDLDLGPDWILPLPAAESRPFAFAEHAKRLRTPEFPDGAKLAVSVVMAKNRGGKSGGESIPSVKKSAFKVIAPAVVLNEKARLFSLEFTAEIVGGAKITKRVIAEGYQFPVTHKKAGSRHVCIFAKDDLGDGDVRFTVTPINCFGVRGKPLTAEFKA